MMGLEEEGEKRRDETRRAGSLGGVSYSYGRTPDATRGRTETVKDEERRDRSDSEPWKHLLRRDTLFFVRTNILPSELGY